MITVKDIRKAIEGLAENAPLNLRLINAPTGLEVEFYEINRDGERALIIGEAFFPADETEDEEEETEDDPE